MTLLYDNNKDNVENIALLSKEGMLLESVPAARLKTNVDVTGGKLVYLHPGENREYAFLHAPCPVYL